MKQWKIHNTRFAHKYTMWVWICPPLPPMDKSTQTTPLFIHSFIHAYRPLKTAKQCHGQNDTNAMTVIIIIIIIWWFGGTRRGDKGIVCIYGGRTRSRSAVGGFDKVIMVDLVHHASVMKRYENQNIGWIAIKIGKRMIGNWIKYIPPRRMNPNGRSSRDGSSDTLLFALITNKQ